MYPVLPCPLHSDQLGEPIERSDTAPSYHVTDLYHTVTDAYVLTTKHPGRIFPAGALLYTVWPACICSAMLSDAFAYYIIPPMPPPAGIAGSGCGMSATRASVVSSVDATDTAFCRADLVTLAGSMMPASTMSTYSSL